MNRIFLLIILLFSLNKIAIAKDDSFSPDNLFYIDQMNSHNKNFALYFKGRENSILARGENENYIKYGSNAFKFSENFSWNKIVKKYLNLI